MSAHDQKIVVKAAVDGLACGDMTGVEILELVVSGSAEKRVRAPVSSDDITKGSSGINYFN